MHWLFRSGILFPFIGKRRLPMNRDGTLFDSGGADILDEKSPYYTEIWAMEWLGIGVPLWPWATLRDSRTGEPVVPTGSE